MDTVGVKADPTMAYIGTRSLFARAGFKKAAMLNAPPGGMRLAL